MSTDGAAAHAAAKAVHEPGFQDVSVDSRFKCDTELTCKGLQRTPEGEAFAGRGVEGPEQDIEVAIAVA
jgi:hypothetical protein